MLLQITTPHRDVTLALSTLDRHPSPLYLCRHNRYNQHTFILCNLLKMYILVQFNGLPEFRWYIHTYMLGGRTAAVASNLMVLHPAAGTVALAPPDVVTPRSNCSRRLHPLHLFANSRAAHKFLRVIRVRLHTFNIRTASSYGAP
jgi:hypothetical protein